MQSFFKDHDIDTVTVKGVLALHRNSLPLSIAEPLRIANLGTGEAHRIIHVLNPHNQSVLIRVGLRGRDSVKSLANEQAILSALGKGIGPIIYAGDLSCSTINEPYVIIEYCPGTFKADWMPSDISRHAAQLARLHFTKFTYHGSFTSKQNSEPFSLLKRFDAAFSYWEENHPNMLRHPFLSQSARCVREILGGRDHCFRSLSRFSLVHGDLHPLNIVISNESIRYIDWENAYVGDPAHDISMFGWDIETGWQIALNQDSMNFFMSEYQIHSGTDESLNFRREAWMLYTMFFDQIYHRTQIPHDSTGRQCFVVNQIQDYFARRFSLGTLLERNICDGGA